MNKGCKTSSCRPESQQKELKDTINVYILDIEAYVYIIDLFDRFVVYFLVYIELKSSAALKSLCFIQS